MKKVLVSIICLISFSAIDIHAQMVWENYKNEIYNYLGRMSQKGIISFNDVVLPLTRTYIHDKLEELNDQQDKLSNVEKQELSFYRREYAAGYFDDKNDSVKTSLLKNDINKRWRGLTIASKSLYFTVDPVIQLSVNSYNGKSFYHRGSGVNGWAKIGNHFGLQFYVNDVYENRDGTGLDSFNYKGSQPAQVMLGDTSNHSRLNYTECRASIGYEWKNGSISAGLDNLIWGYGVNGKIILSDKAPLYPYLRLDYQPFKWMKFNYTHSWLNSNVIDSTNSYSFGNPTYGGHRTSYVPKFMALHSLIITPKKGIDIGLGESIVYSDRMDIGFLIPVMPFKFYDNNASNYTITAGNNSQFFFLLSLKNIIPKTHVYSNLFIDEMRVSKIFSKDSSRNQIGFNVGIAVNDILIPYLTLSTEYTRVNPFVYNNLNPAQNYTNHSFNLGDWMGNNFDRIIFDAKYTPVARLKLEARYQYIRKGPSYTTDQQYFQQPQPKFLESTVYSQSDLLLKMSYEWKHNIYFQAFYNYQKTNFKTSSTSNAYNNFSVAVNFGL